MDSRHRRCFIAIAESGSISAASERLHVAQPSQSHGLRAMIHAHSRALGIAPSVLVEMDALKPDEDAGRSGSAHTILAAAPSTGGARDGHPIGGRVRTGAQPRRPGTRPGAGPLGDPTWARGRRGIARDRHGPAICDPCARVFPIRRAGAPIKSGRRGRDNAPRRGMRDDDMRAGLLAVLLTGRLTRRCAAQEQERDTHSAGDDTRWEVHDDATQDFCGGLCRRGCGCRTGAGSGKTGRDPDRHHGLPVGAGLGLRRTRQGGGRDADRADERRGRDRRRAGPGLLGGRGRGRRGAALGVSPAGAGCWRGCDVRLDLVGQLQQDRAAGRGSRGPQHHVGLRHPAHLRGRRLRIRLPHAGQCDAGDALHGALPAQDQARLQHDRGGQSGLCLGSRQLGHLLDRAEAAQAGCRGGGRVLPEIRRARFLDRDLAAAGAAPGRDPLDLLGRRSRHLRAPGRAARADQQLDPGAAAGRELAAAPRLGPAAGAHRRRARGPLLPASREGRRRGLHGLRRGVRGEDRGLSDLSRVPHLPGARGAEKGL